MEQYLNENDNMKVEIEELELLLGPEDYARRKKVRRIFEVFSSKGPSEFLVASRARQRVLVTQKEESRRKARWEEHLRMLIVLERECLELREETEHLREKQEVLATLMEGKMSMQKVGPQDFQRQIFQELKELEEQKTKEGTCIFFASLSAFAGTCDVDIGTRAPGVRLAARRAFAARPHGWTCIFVVFLTLPVGLLKVLFSLNDPGSPDAVVALLTLWRALAGIQDVDAGPRALGVFLTVGRAPSRLALSPSPFWF